MHRVLEGDKFRSSGAAGRLVQQAALVSRDVASRRTLMALAGVLTLWCAERTAYPRLHLTFLTICERNDEHTHLTDDSRKK